MTEEERGIMIFEDNSVKSLDGISLPMHPFSELTGKEIRGAINETIKPSSVSLSGSRVKVVLRGADELIVTETWG